MKRSWVISQKKLIILLNYTVNENILFYILQIPKFQNFNYLQINFNYFLIIFFEFSKTSTSLTSSLSMDLVFKLIIIGSI